MSGKRKPVAQIGPVLDRVFERIDPRDRQGLYRIWRFWADEVGEPIARRAQPAGFHAGTLAVEVKGHSWMQELQFLKHDLRDRLNARLGREIIRDIHFVCAAEPQPPQRNRSRRLEKTATQPIEIPPLADERLAQAFARIVRAHQGRQARAPDRKR